MASWDRVGLPGDGGEQQPLGGPWRLARTGGRGGLPSPFSHALVRVERVTVSPCI